MAENPELKLENAVSKAVYAHNIQINRTGFSPRQLLFGSQGVVPGVFDGTPASMEPICESDRAGSSFPTGWKLKKFLEELTQMKEFRKPLLSKRMVTATIGFMKEMKSFIKKRGRKNGLDQPKSLGRKVQKFALYMQDRDGRYAP